MPKFGSRPGAYGPKFLQHGSTRWFILAFMVILFDQTTKLLIEAAFDFGHVMPVFPGFNLVLTYNPGAAFSFLADAGGWQRHFFTVLALVVSAVIIVVLRKHWAQRRFALALALVLGGAIGNVIDRIAYGHVIDFLDVYWGNAHWPAFNIADAAICVGAVLIALDGFLAPKPGSDATQSKETTS
ncbi:signal peptidase II [Chitinimonas sp. BJYL2]|uniref:signal peptidase II n=1 Tax=Chitinimonas sp. BJYL2 TaxID=2976696 RepID=UPI0022B39464|nr:signal peptidase II [Chitinimonas sp. BJYL2]